MVLILRHIIINKYQISLLQLIFIYFFIFSGLLFRNKGHTVKKIDRFLFFSIIVFKIAIYIFFVFSLFFLIPHMRLIISTVTVYYFRKLNNNRLTQLAEGLFVRLRHLQRLWVEAGTSGVAPLRIPAELCWGLLCFLFLKKLVKTSETKVLILTFSGCL